MSPKDYIYKIIVIDDGSTDGSKEWIRDNYNDVVVVEGEGNLWWAGGINMGAKYAIEELKSDYLLLWNNDIEIDENYFKNLIDIIKKYAGNTILGSKIYDKFSNTVWSMGGKFNPYSGAFSMIGYNKPDSDELNKLHDVDWIAGMGTLVPVNIVKKIGYWDAVNFPQYCGDTEFTYRAKLSGYKLIVHPGLKIWNDISNTGIQHEGKIKNLINLLKDKKSLYNIKVNIKFYRLYVKSPLAYTNLFYNYFRLFSGYIKWKILNFFGIKKKKGFPI